MTWSTATSTTGSATGRSAEDVTSETFVRALRRIDSLSFQGRDVGAWLVTIARNIVLDHVKSSRYRLEVTTADMRDADRATDGPEDAVVAHLTNTQLLACVKQLGGEQQECIVLRFLHGLSVAETAAIMGKKDGAIKALQHRAVRRLAAPPAGRVAVTGIRSADRVTSPAPRLVVLPRGRSRRPLLAVPGGSRPTRPTGGPR